MRPRFLLLVVLFPVLEFYLLARFAAHFGWATTLYLILITGLGGLALIRGQGIGALPKMQQSLARGGSPGDAMVDGLLLLGCAVLLILPGFVSDVAGLLGLVPPIRRFAGRLLTNRWLKSPFWGGAFDPTRYGGRQTAPERPPAEPGAAGRGRADQRDISHVVDAFQRSGRSSG